MHVLDVEIIAIAAPYFGKICATPAAGSPGAGDVVAWVATARPKPWHRYLLAQEQVFRRRRPSKGPSEDAKTVSLGGPPRDHAIPAAEWREIFAEVWRPLRDYFYVENMHGYELAGAAGKVPTAAGFRGVPRGPQLTSSAEMISELTVQHAYIEAATLASRNGPLSHCRGRASSFDAKSGRYRIVKIFAGQNEEERYRSPLTEVGVDVHVGDYGARDQRA